MSIESFIVRASFTNQLYSGLGLILVLAIELSTAHGQNVRLSPSDSVDAIIAKAVEVRPTPRQIAWQREEISAFIHFGMKTFTDREWGDGTEEPKLSNR